MHVEKTLRPPKSAGGGDKTKELDRPTKKVEVEVHRSLEEPLLPNNRHSIPLYGMFRLYPAPEDDSRLSAQHEQLKSKHNDARAEMIERIPSAGYTTEESKYPVCADFMMQVVRYLVSDFYGRTSTRADMM